MQEKKNAADTVLPEWMTVSENYTPAKDKEAFLEKSTKSVLHTLAKLKFQYGKDGRWSVCPSLKIFSVFVYILLTASSGNYLFSWVMCVAVTVRLALFPAKAVRQVMSGTLGAVLFSALILLPAVFMGHPGTLVNITTRVYVSVTLIGMLSAGTSWNKLTESMRSFHIPSVFIFTLDITLKYIAILGEMCRDILLSVRLRSVGKNPEKAKALSGVLGITFLRSGEMAEEMHAAMCCRGFTGEYKKNHRQKMGVADGAAVGMLLICVVLYFYLNR